MFKKVLSILSAIIGVFIICIGASLLSDANASFAVEPANYRYQAETFSAPAATFGADFYTYIYQSTDTIVDALNDLNQAAEVSIESQNALHAAVVQSVSATNELINRILQVGGYCVVAVGLAVLAFSAHMIGGAFQFHLKKTVDGTPYEQQDPAYLAWEQAVPCAPSSEPAGVSGAQSSLEDPYLQDGSAQPDDQTPADAAF